MILKKMTASRLSKKNVFIYSMITAGTLFLFGNIVGYSSFDLPKNSLEAARISPEVKTFWTVIIDIFITNLAACLLLFSGILTFGFSTLISISLIGVFVGATAKVGVEISGIFDLLSDAFFYVPFEFSGLLLSATAGLLPTIGKVNQFSTAVGKISYYDWLFPAIKIFCGAIVLIGIGSVIETILILLKY